jgi:Asp-tRNA(Asn)/Glu-tRNA(Gln) amidotransferase A subunit family amidase
LRIEDCNWMQVEEYLKGDDRIVVPLGSVEQHGYLSLGVDRILSERVAVEAAEPLGVLVLPSLPYGLTPNFAAYPAPPEDPPFGTPEGDVEGRYTAPYNLAGVPAVSLPCGLAEGTLPAGLQLAAAFGEDALLLSVARVYEEVDR